MTLSPAEVATASVNCLLIFAYGLRVPAACLSGTNYVLSALPNKCLRWVNNAQSKHCNIVLRGRNASFYQTVVLTGTRSQHSMLTCHSAHLANDTKTSKPSIIAWHVGV